MLSTFPKEHNTIKPERENINVYKKLDQRNRTMNSSKEWVKDSKYQKKVIDKVT